MIISLTEAKGYLRVDTSDDDDLIEMILDSAEQLCINAGRLEDTTEYGPIFRVAVLYATAYLYEHREEANHKALSVTLAAMLEGDRKKVF